MGIVTLILPWLWVALAVWALRRAGRAKRPAPLMSLGACLVAMGVSEFFVSPGGMPPWWLWAWKALAAVAIAGSLLWWREARRSGDS